MGQTHSLIVPLGVLLGLALYLVYTQLYVPASHPRIAPGPASAHWFFGNLREGEASELQPRLLTEYGPAVSFFGLANRSRLLTTDTRALAHILQHTDIYQKPSHTQRALAQMLGEGVLVAEGAQHRMQRKALNPAFGASQIRDLTCIMLDKANELRDVLSALVGSKDVLEVNAEAYLSHCTLDIIGLAGFGYDFGALSSGGNELAEAFATIFGTAQEPSFLDVLSFFVPGLRVLPTARNRRLSHAMAVMKRIGTGLIAERKADAMLDAAQGEKSATSRARDILSLLVRANTAADVRQRLPDKDVLAQIPTFLVAGHETTSTLLSWALFALAQRPDIQSALRAECRSHAIPTAPRANVPLDADELAAMDRLPLLDAVIRETLRLHAPVFATNRAATRDDVLPLATPFVDRAGVERTSLPLRKDEILLMPIRMVNRDPRTWGPDAGEWRPERWIDGSVGEQAKSIPGVWGSMLSFLGGSHSCIGYKFALYEAKIMLHALSCAFDVTLAATPEDIGMTMGITSRPFVKSRREEGGQLPVFLRRAGADE